MLAMPSLTVLEMLGLACGGEGESPHKRWFNTPCSAWNNMQQRQWKPGEGTSMYLLLRCALEQLRAARFAVGILGFAAASNA